MLLLICVLFYLAIAAPVSGFERVVLVTKFVPNVGSTNPQNFLDFGHGRLRSWGLLSNEDILYNDVDSKAKFLVQTNIDVLAGVQVAPGIYEGAFWTYIPFEVESGERLDIVTLDSNNPERNVLGNWYLIDGGNLIVFNSTGTFSGGTFAGLKYYPGGGLIHEFVAMVQNNTNWSQQGNSELFNCSTKVRKSVV